MSIPSGGAPLGEGLEGEGLLCLRGGGGLRQGGREEGKPCRAKPLKTSKPCGPYKEEPWVGAREL